MSATDSDSALVTPSRQEVKSEPCRTPPALYSETGEEMQQLVAERMVQSLLQSSVPIHITINPAEAPAAHGHDAHALNSKHAGIVGLMAFGMTTVLLNLVNVGAYPLSSVLPSMAIPFGGGVQLLVGVLEFFCNNNFGFIAFTSYGAFWLSLTAVWMLPTSESADVLPGPTSRSFIGTYLLLWGVFSCGLFYCTLFKNVALAVVFALVVLLFFVLAIADYTGSAGTLKAGGAIGITCGLGAMYTSVAELLLNQFGKEVLPLIKLPLQKKD